MADPRVFLVGAGPGDPGLITVRGLTILRQAQVLLYDHLISPQLLHEVPADCEQVYVGKRAGKHILSQEQINALMIEHAGNGRRVVRLKGGDPYVFGRGGEEALALNAAGIAFEVIPGITAALGASAYAGIPLTHRNLAADVAFITGHENLSRIDDSQIDWEALARWRGTIIFYMGIYRLPEICQRLMGFGMHAQTPAAVVQWGADARQRTHVATLGELPNIHEKHPFRPPGLIVIGQVVTLREQLNWFERSPLFGQSILVTRASEQAGELVSKLQRCGAQVIECPTVRIVPPEDVAPLRAALSRLETFDWTIFTSVNAAVQVFALLERMQRDARSFHRCRICAVGSATRRRLADFGLRADLVPPRYDAESLATTLLQQEDVSGKRVLLPRSVIARSELPQRLRDAGAEVEEVIAYQTLPDHTAAEELHKVLEKDRLDWVTFTSSSTVKGLLDIVDADTIRRHGLKIASIGPQTSKTLSQAGLQPTVQADPHTIDGLIAAITAALS